jgi:hypothetical protein
MRFLFITLLSLLPAALCLVPLLNTGDEKAIPGEYVLVYRNGVTPEQKKSVEGSIGKDGILRHVYSITSFQGAGVRLSPTDLLLLRLRNDVVHHVSLGHILLQ